MSEIKKEEPGVEKKFRIAKFLAACGLASRRKCEELVREGKIKVNKKTISDLSCKVSNIDTVEYNGRIMKQKENIVIALNKPPGYISTVKDDFKRKTVLDLIKEKEWRLFPVGRLDANSRGLILLTNDGEFAHRVLHPKFQIPKIYEVTIQGKVNSKVINKLCSGIEIEEKIFTPSIVKILKLEPNHTVLEIEIMEGRKRILRKAFKELGYIVLDLKRIQIGSYKLGDLKEGSYKILDKKEINTIIKKN